MVEDRVKFYERNDFCCGMNLEKIETLEIPEIENIYVNDAIEFCHIKKYFDADIRLKKWSNEKFEEYRKKSLLLNALAMRYFNSISDNDIVNIYNQIDTGYIVSFWEIFNSAKLYERITKETFSDLIRCDHIPPEELFAYKAVVSHYGETLKSYIVENESCVRILISVYEQDFSRGRKLYLPKEMSGDDICGCLEKYIDGEHPNVNILDSILQMKSCKQFTVTDELRLKAKRRKRTELEYLLKTGTTIGYGVNITFSPDTQVPKDIQLKGTVMHATYSTNWLLNTLEYPAILSNFIYLFEYVDAAQVRCQFVSKSNSIGTFERIFQKPLNNLYPIGTSFRAIEMLSQCIMATYYDFLEKHNIRLEDVLQWFFTEYLQKKYQCPAIHASFPSCGSSFSEKSSSLCATMDSILKQYSAFIKTGEIDFELLEMSSGATKIADIPGLTEGKYIYGIGDIFNEICYYMFSDQCMLSYVKRIDDSERKYNTFFELLSNASIFANDYRESEKLLLTRLENYDLIHFAPDGQILVGDFAKLSILRDLYTHDVISRWHYPAEVQEVFDALLAQGVLEETSTLFTKPESDYFSYILNKEKFTNGLDLRNKYMHGIQQLNLDENIHKNNYYILLRLMVIIALKINDDFMIHNERN